MTQPRIVCIIGPDGAGKSTQARKLIDVLENRGVDCKYQWFGARHLLSLPLLAYARLVGLSEVKQLESSRQIGYHYFERSRFVSTLYPLLLLMDTFLMYITRILFPLIILNKSIVCDRYVHDILISLMISINDDTLYRSFVGRLFFRMVPDESLVVVLLADEETLRPRRDDVREDETLSRMIELYKKIATSQNLQILRADQPPERIHDELLRFID